jgi:hypothetical protein
MCKLKFFLLVSGLFNRLILACDTALPSEWIELPSSSRVKQSPVDQMIPKIHQARYTVCWCSTSATWHSHNNLFCLFSLYNEMWNKWGGGGAIHLIVQIYSLLKENCDAKPKNSSESLFKRSEILSLPCECILSWLNFTKNDQEKLQTTQLYTALI